MALKQKCLHYFSDTFIKYPCYSLKEGLALSGPSSLPTILGKWVCEETVDLSFHLLFFKFLESEQMSLDSFSSLFLSKMSFLSLWKPSLSASSILGRNH